MAKGYRVEEIREKLISVLKDSDSGISGIEISKKISLTQSAKSLDMAYHLNYYQLQS